MPDYLDHLLRDKRERAEAAARHPATVRPEGVYLRPVPTTHESIEERTERAFAEWYRCVGCGAIRPDDESICGCGEHAPLCPCVPCNLDDEPRGLSL